jgi:hypothetical protein
MHITRHDDPADTDRRQHERVWTTRGCRVRGIARVRSEPAETANISQGGALIRVGTTSAFGIGDEVEVVVAREGQGLLRAEDAIRGIVRRVVPMDFHHQAIGVEFALASVVVVNAPREAPVPARAAA